jgi:hypothetical protein
MNAFHGVTYEDSEILSTTEDFEIIKFLRSVGVGWDDFIMTNIVSRGSLEMIKFAHEDGCPWSFSTYAEYYHLLSPLEKNYCYLKLKYLVDNGSPLDDEDSERVSVISESCCKLRDLSALECLVGKYSRFDNALLKELLSNYKSHHNYGPFEDKPWIEGIKFIIEKSKEINSYKSIESLFNILPNMELVQYLRECLKLPMYF